MTHPLLAPALADALCDEARRRAHRYRTRSPLRVRLAGLLGRRDPRPVRTTESGALRPTQIGVRGRS